LLIKIYHIVLYLKTIDCYFWEYKTGTYESDQRSFRRKGIKQTWLAEKLGKSYPIVNGYVTNKRQPTLEVLYTIAEILDVEISDLLTSKKIAIKN